MCLESVEKIVHFVQVLGICAVEPCWWGAVKVTLATVLDFTFCVTLLKQLRIEFRNYAHMCIIYEHQEKSTKCVPLCKLVRSAAKKAAGPCYDIMIICMTVDCSIHRHRNPHHSSGRQRSAPHIVLLTLSFGPLTLL